MSSLSTDLELLLTHCAGAWAWVLLSSALIFSSVTSSTVSALMKACASLKKFLMAGMWLAHSVLRYLSTFWPTQLIITIRWPPVSALPTLHSPYWAWDTWNFPANSATPPTPESASLTLLLAPAYVNNAQLVEDRVLRMSSLAVSSDRL